MAAHRKVVQPNIVVAFFQAVPTVAYPLATALLVQTVLLTVLHRPNHVVAWVGYAGLLGATGLTLALMRVTRRRVLVVSSWFRAVGSAAPGWFRVQAYRWGRPS